MWKKYRLGDILKRRKDIAKIHPEKEYKLVTIKLYHKGVQLRSIVKGSTIRSSMSAVKAGDFILSGIDARNGAFGIVPQELEGAVVTNDFWCLVPDSSIIETEFLLFLSSTDFFDRICKESSDGTTQRVRLQKDKFFDYEISLPSIENQRILLKKLEHASQLGNALSAELEHQSALISKLRQSILQEAVQGKLVPQNPKDEPASVLLEKIKKEKANLVSQKKTKDFFPLHKKSKESPPFSLPSQWMWARFWDVAWCFRGHNPPKIHFRKEPQEGLVRFIQITDFKTDSQAVYVPKSKQLKYVEKGEIIMAAYRHIGKLSRNMQGAFNVALCKVNNINPYSRDFLELVIKSDLVRGELLAASERGHIPSMHSEHLLSLWVPVPPFVEQLRIVSKFEELMKTCDALEKEVESQKAQVQALMQAVLRETFGGSSISKSKKLEKYNHSEEKLGMVAEGKSK